MAQSVKLKDGSYIDAGGVYDVTQGKTQEALNSTFMKAKLRQVIRMEAQTTTYKFDTPYNDVWIFTRSAVLVVRAATRQLKVLATTGEHTYTLTHDGTVNTLTASDTQWGGILIIT